MLKKITMPSYIRNRNIVIFVTYVFALIFVSVVIYQTLNKSTVEIRTKPEDALAIIKQELLNFRLLPGSELETNSEISKERLVAVQATHKVTGRYKGIRTYYIEEAKRNGWKLIEEDIIKEEITFSKSDRPKSNYGLKICFKDMDVLLYYYWISVY